MVLLRSTRKSNEWPVIGIMTKGVHNMCTPFFIATTNKEENMNDQEAKDLRLANLRADYAERQAQEVLDVLISVVVTLGATAHNLTVGQPRPAAMKAVAQGVMATIHKLREIVITHQEEVKELKERVASVDRAYAALLATHNRTVDALASARDMAKRAHEERDNYKKKLYAKTEELTEMTERLRVADAKRSSFDDMAEKAGPLPTAVLAQTEHPKLDADWVDSLHPDHAVEVDVNLHTNTSYVRAREIFDLIESSTSVTSTVVREHLIPNRQWIRVWAKPEAIRSIASIKEVRSVHQPLRSEVQGLGDIVGPPLQVRGPGEFVRTEAPIESLGPVPMTRNGLAELDRLSSEGARVTAYVVRDLLRRGAKLEGDDR